VSQQPRNRIPSIYLDSYDSTAAITLLPQKTTTPENVIEPPKFSARIERRTLEVSPYKRPNMKELIEELDRESEMIKIQRQKYE
jgi:hypothetical protein